MAGAVLATRSERELERLSRRLGEAEFDTRGLPVDLIVRTSGVLAYCPGGQVESLAACYSSFRPFTRPGPLPSPAEARTHGDRRRAPHAELGASVATSWDSRFAPGVRANLFMEPGHELQTQA